MHITFCSVMELRCQQQFIEEKDGWVRNACQEIPGDLENSRYQLLCNIYFFKSEQPKCLPILRVQVCEYIACKCTCSSVGVALAAQSSLDRAEQAFCHGDLMERQSRTTTTEQPVAECHLHCCLQYYVLLEMSFYCLGSVSHTGDGSFFKVEGIPNENLYHNTSQIQVTRPHKYADSSDVSMTCHTSSGKQHHLLFCELVLAGAEGFSNGQPCPYTVDCW